MRVTLVDAESEEALPAEAPGPETTRLVAEVPTTFAAPPLAVRPVEDAEWTFRN